MEEVRAELRVRKRVLGIFNKNAADFPDKDGWDDYLEEMEDTIYGLVNGIDTAQVEARLRSYEAANRQSILANQARQAVEQQRFSQLNVAADTLTDSKAGIAVAPAYLDALLVTAPAVSSVFQLPALPGPCGPFEIDDKGSLRVRAKDGSKRRTAAQVEAATRAGGWTQEAQVGRLLQEAFGSLHVLLVSQ